MRKLSCLKQHSFSYGAAKIFFLRIFPENAQTILRILLAATVL